MEQGQYGLSAEKIAYFTERAYAYLQRQRAASPASFRLALLRLGCPEALCEDLIAKMRAEDYLSDWRAAKALLLRNQGPNAKSRYFLERKMFQAGIDLDLVSEIWAEEPSDSEKLCYLLRLKYPRAQASEYNKIYRFLLGRGFAPSLVERLCKSKLQEESKLS